MSKSTRGFTLIELLVVIAIIGLLSSIVLASLNQARAKSRDARRLADLKQIQTAMALYYSDNNQYPSPNTACSIVGNDMWSSWGCWTSVLPATYMSILPKDPSNSDLGNCYSTLNCHVYHYCTYNSNQGFMISVNLENTANSVAAPTWPAGSNCLTAGPNLYYILN
jgi:type II secretion system protein G